MSQVLNRYLLRKAGEVPRAYPIGPDPSRVHLMAKFETNANAAMLLLNLVQVTSISGSVVPLAMFILKEPAFCLVVTHYWLARLTNTIKRYKYEITIVKMCETIYGNI